MFKGRVNSLLRRLRPGTQLAGLPSGRRVARFGQIFIFYRLKERKTGSCLQSSAPRLLPGGLLGTGQELGSSSCGMWLQSWPVRPGKATKRGCVVWVARSPPVPPVRVGPGRPSARWGRAGGWGRCAWDG